MPYECTSPDCPVHTMDVLLVVIPQYSSSMYTVFIEKDENFV